MPLVNYCKKCGAEVPLGESCIYCSKKLTRTGEQISFGTITSPVKEWFSWNAFLRVILPVWFLVAAGALAAQAASNGLPGVAKMLEEGYFVRMLVLLGIMLLFVLALLILQGTEHIHYVLDKDGIHARTYLRDPALRQIYARFQSPESAQHLQDTDTRPPLQGFVMVRRTTIPWEEVKMVRFWKEGGTVLFYRPRFWQALAMYCPVEEQESAEEFIRRKMKKYKDVPVIPETEKPAKKKR